MHGLFKKIYLVTFLCHTDATQSTNVVEITLVFLQCNTTDSRLQLADMYRTACLIINCHPQALALQHFRLQVLILVIPTNILNTRG